MDRKNKVYLIDTDLGDDIDDAYAIAAALGRAGDRVIGITTVFKNTAARARLAKKLLSLSPYPDIPVYAGSGNGLKRAHDRDWLLPQWGEELEDPCCDCGQSVSAVQFIVQMAQKYGERLVIIGIAALTNIAQAILEAPQAMAGIGGLAAMGGGFFMHCTEWNIACDPEAARIVWKSGIHKRFAGLDVTLKLRMTEEESARLFAGEEPLHRYLAELTRRWQRSGGKLPIQHDYLAVLAAMEGFEAEGCGRWLHFLPQRIRVLTEEPVAGMTYNESTANWYGSPQPNCLVADAVNRPAVMQALFQDLGLS